MIYGDDNIRDALEKVAGLPRAVAKGGGGEIGRIMRAKRGFGRLNAKATSVIEGGGVPGRTSSKKYIPDYRRDLQPLRARRHKDAVKKAPKWAKKPHPQYREGIIDDRKVDNLRKQFMRSGYDQQVKLLKKLGLGRMDGRQSSWRQARKDRMTAGERKVLMNEWMRYSGVPPVKQSRGYRGVTHGRTRYKPYE